MLEAGDSLLTWALETWPVTTGAIAAWRLSSHRSAYLDYEGPVSGNRGQVTRIDAGLHKFLTGNLNAGPLEFELFETGNAGTYRLTPDETENGNQRWALERLA